MIIIGSVAFATRKCVTWYFAARNRAGMEKEARCYCRIYWFKKGKFSKPLVASRKETIDEKGERGGEGRGEGKARCARRQFKFRLAFLNSKNSHRGAEISPMT